MEYSTSIPALITSKVMDLEKIFIKSLMRFLQKIQNSSDYPYLSLLEYCFDPVSGSLQSPLELLMSKKPRSTLSTLPPSHGEHSIQHVCEELKREKEQPDEQHNHRAVEERLMELLLKQSM